MNIKALKAALIIVAISISGGTNTAFAGLIIDNGFDVNATNSTNWTNDINNWRTYEDFTLATDTTLTSASFLLIGGTSANYLLDIHTNSGNTYGAAIHSISLTSSEVTVSPVNNSWSQYDFSIPSINLTAGKYWISFSGTSTYGSKLGTFGSELIQTLSAGTSAGTRYVRTGSYIPFKLNGTAQVPEPSTLAIFALGIMGLASRRFKKQ